MKQQLDNKVVLAILGVLIIGVVAFLGLKVFGPGAAVPESENVSGIAEQYQNDLNNRNGPGSEADLRQQGEPPR